MFFENIDKDLVNGSSQPMVWFLERGARSEDKTKELNLIINGHRVRWLLSSEG
jgi:hypothetical protein